METCRCVAVLSDVHGNAVALAAVLEFATPEARIRAALAGVDERVLVTAHTHIQFDRAVAGVRSVNPGSVGMPYEGRVGAAFWAVLGPTSSCGKPTPTSPRRSRLPRFGRLARRRDG